MYRGMAKIIIIDTGSSGMVYKHRENDNGENTLYIVRL